MHILHLNQRNQRNQILFQYLRDKKKKERRGLRKRGVENSPISPPLDPCLGSSIRLSRPKFSRNPVIPMVISDIQPQPSLYTFKPESRPRCAFRSRIPPFN